MVFTWGSNKHSQNKTITYDLAKISSNRSVISVFHVRLLCERADIYVVLYQIWWILCSCLGKPRQYFLVRNIFIVYSVRLWKHFVSSGNVWKEECVWSKEVGVQHWLCDKSTRCFSSELVLTWEFWASTKQRQLAVWVIQTGMKGRPKPFPEESLFWTKFDM